MDKQSKIAHKTGQTAQTDDAFPRHSRESRSRKGKGLSSEGPRGTRILLYRISTSTLPVSNVRWRTNRSMKISKNLGRAKD